MDGRSCAELETVINEAGLYAGYERAEYITMEHFMEACLRTVFDVPASLDDYDDDDLYTLLSDSNNVVSQIVYHEAGHAVVSEILCPESVNLISAHNRGGASGGFTDYYNDRTCTPLYLSLIHIYRSKLDMDRIEPGIQRGIKILSHELERADFDKEAFIKKLAKVIVYRIEVPENTDLNRYFEIMNTRGEQLEQHDILKATLMSFLNDDAEKGLFAKIWDACSEMTGYVQMHFISTVSYTHLDVYKRQMLIRDY